MTTDERIDAIAEQLDTSMKLHLDAAREAEQWRTDWRQAQIENGKRFTQVTHNFEIVLDSNKRLEKHRDRA